MSTKWLSGRLESSLGQNLKLKSHDVRNKVVKKWNTSISKSKAQKAVSMALKNVHGSYKEQYKRIYDYAHELLHSNSGSTIKVKVEDINGMKVFKRFYVCLKVCKDSFISYRPIIILDGCFLKGYYGGELLTRIGRDPNEQMLPLAYVVVEVECKDPWTWFLQLLIEDFRGPDVCAGKCDQQKSIMRFSNICLHYLQGMHSYPHILLLYLPQVYN